MPEEALRTGAVFLSYASEDAEAAARICEVLRSAGVEVWFDREELRGGDAWDLKIKRQIHDCQLFMPLISAQTNARTEGYFRREWKQATRRLQDIADDAAFLVPVVIDATKESHARVPEEFQGVHWTRLPGGEAPPAFVERVRQLLGHGSAGGSAGPVAISAIQTGAPLSRSRIPQKRRFAFALAILLLLGLGGGAWWYHADKRDAPATTTETASASAKSAAVADDKSIAVLPFVDMSADKNQEYMSDGIAEELLNLLAQAPDLKVIARTSSFAFKGKNIEIAEIAKKLNVTHVLEGSVRTSGKQMRITAQLVRAADSTHLWSEHYDRTMEDIFAVQDEIANAIAQALQIRLKGGALNSLEGGTRNLDAYKLYLRAQNALLKPTKESLDDAATYAEKAVAIDTSYGRAWETFARIYSLKVDGGYLSSIEGYERARQLAQHALQVSPELADAHARLGYIHTVFDRDWKAAQAEFDRALEIDPVNQSAIKHAAILATALGRWEVAEQQYMEARKHDPLDPYAVWNLGHMYYLAGRYEDSETTFRELIVMQPDFPWSRAFLAKTLLALDKPNEALALLNGENNEENRYIYLPIVLQAAGRHDQVAAALASQEALLGDSTAFYIAENYAYLGDVDRSLAWLDRAYLRRENALLELYGEPLFRNVANDPRFKAFLRKMNLPSW